MGDFLPDDEEPSFVEGTARVGFASGLAVAPDDVVVTKNRYDAFAGTDLDLVLRGLGRRAVVVCGFMTSFCCASTARTAHALDYEVLFVGDAVDGPDLERTDGSAYPHEAVLDDTCATLAAGFAEVVTTNDVLDRLRSG
jgi:ureidoacrylate peracid hydrolase